MTGKIEFSPGQIVFLKSDPGLRGAVVSVLPGGQEDRVRVFVNGNVQTYYASQLAPEEQREDDVESLSSDQFHACLTALQIRHPSLSTLYSLNAARVNFIPYQFRPVSRFILNSIRQRLGEGDIAADERVQLITDIEGLHTFSGIINRTRRRDIGAFTLRKPETVTVSFTAGQRQLHDELLQVRLRHATSQSCFCHAASPIGATGGNVIRCEAPRHHYSEGKDA